MESWSFKKNRGGELLERNYYPPVDILVSLRKKKKKKRKKKKRKGKKRKWKSLITKKEMKQLGEWKLFLK